MNKENKTGWFSLIISVCAAAFGVQSRKNLDRDFNQRSILPFILAGVIFTALFIFAVISVVSLVLPES
ncbi:DUF2970 domain-containing protein [Halioxenophilus sp. WMMB6]|uniref:DUF2970 domain-containing protein n=1 Tax=Halioxenophilus sp. WMMB6 TaxID=3073815 RepID=UPI00295F57DF|nr:DUF2970 domain-containing protein [Halioxenophilus sp. WMMB6]